jgi:hypothetical protein
VDRSQMTIGFLLGMVCALGLALVLQTGQALPTAYAQTAGSGQGMFAVTGSGTSGQSRDVFFLVDPASTRIMVYEFKEGTLTLSAVRNVEYDMRFQEWSARGKTQVPSVGTQKKDSEQADQKKGG